MKTIALISGGKDSCFNMMLCQQYGHEIVALGNLLPVDDGVDELDSWMFQTVGHQLVEAYAAATGLPLLRRRIRGASRHTEMGYRETAGDEVEDLAALLAFAKECFPGLQAVASGAIASDYQRLRVEAVCGRLGLTSLAYLWHQPQAPLLRRMIDAGLEAILVKVAAIGLEPEKHLGKSLAQMEPHLHRLARTFGSNVCGEGGEYESLTLDCPLFTRARIVLEAFDIISHSPGDIAPVAVLRPTSFRLEPKDGISGAGLRKAEVIEVPAGHEVKLPPPPQPQEQGSWRPEVMRQQGRRPRILTLLAAAPTQPATQAASPADTAAALAGILTALEAELRALGLGWHAATFVHLTLADMGHFGAANAVYNALLPAADPPGRACVQLPLPAGCPVMVSVTAVCGGGGGGGGSSGHASPTLVPNGVMSASGRDSDSDSGSGSWETASDAEAAETQLQHPAGLSSAAVSAAATQAAAGDQHSPNGIPIAAAEDSNAAAAVAAAATASWVQLAAPPEPPGGPVAAPLPPPRRVLHVQSVSEWAPTCIGPYSQGVAAAGLVAMSGVVPLDPPTMQLIDGDSSEQMARCLASCEAVATGLRANFRTGLLAATLYCSSACSAPEVAAVRRQLEAHLEGGKRGDSDNDDAETGPDAADLPEDAYLQAPDMSRAVSHPQITCIQVPALPRGAAVEVQPLLLAHASDATGAAPQPLACSERVLPLNPAAAARGEPSESLVATRAAAAAGRLCRVASSASALAMPGNQEELELPVLCRLLAMRTKDALYGAQLTWGDVGSITAYCKAVVVSPAALALHLQESVRSSVASAYETGFPPLEVLALPVLHIEDGDGGIEDCVIQLEVLAVR